jgi:hypothetical protein
MAKVPVLLDGFATTVAASILYRIDPHAIDHCWVAHCSAEPGHRRLLSAINRVPLLDFGMRLGEASGAALAIRCSAPPPIATAAWRASPKPASAIRADDGRRPRRSNPCRRSAPFSRTGWACAAPSGAPRSRWTAPSISA